MSRAQRRQRIRAQRIEDSIDIIDSAVEIIDDEETWPRRKLQIENTITVEVDMNYEGANLQIFQAEEEADRWRVLEEKSDDVVSTKFKYEGDENIGAILVSNRGRTLQICTKFWAKCMRDAEDVIDFCNDELPEAGLGTGKVKFIGIEDIGTFTLDRYGHSSNKWLLTTVAPPRNKEQTYKMELGGFEDEYKVHRIKASNEEVKVYLT